MLKLFQGFQKDSKIWDFDGGIHPPEMKSCVKRHAAAPCAFGAALGPLKCAHIGAEGERCALASAIACYAAVRLPVDVGRMLPVHAPTSGTLSLLPH